MVIVIVIVIVILIAIVIVITIVTVARWHVNHFSKGNNTIRERRALNVHKIQEQQ